MSHHQTIKSLPCWEEWFPGVSYKDRVILLGYVGSQAHGTMTPETDDVDLMGVVVQPLESYLGFHTQDEWRWMKDYQGMMYDVVLYDVKKYCWLLLKSNPNVLSLLGLNDHSYLHQSVLGKDLLKMRKVFFSKQVYRAFQGYAHAQLDLMRRGKDRPTKDLGEKRKQLIEQYGYDTKHASHLIRLLRMCIEYLSTHELNVWRADYRELIDIKQGQWSFEQVEQEAKRLFVLSEEALVRSTLPERPNVEAAEQWVRQAIERREQ